VLDELDPLGINNVKKDLADIPNLKGYGECKELDTPLIHLKFR